jgi:hypothetical protein
MSFAGIFLSRTNPSKCVQSTETSFVLTTGQGTLRVSPFVGLKACSNIALYELGKLLAGDYTASGVSGSGALRGPNIPVPGYQYSGLCDSLSSLDSLGLRRRSQGEHSGRCCVSSEAYDNSSNPRQ